MAKWDCTPRFIRRAEVTLLLLTAPARCGRTARRALSPAHAHAGPAAWARPAGPASAAPTRCFRSDPRPRKNCRSSAPSRAGSASGCAHGGPPPKHRSGYPRATQG